MLGKLFSTAASTLSPRTSNTPNSSRPTTSLCSVQEDIHTRNLLFPDSRDLAQSQHDQVFPLSSSPALQPLPINAFDFDADVDLDIRDVRIIVMQEETATHHRAALLYDSHALPVPPTSTDRQRSNTNGSSQSASRNGSRRSTQSIHSPRKISVGQNSRPVVIATEHTAANFGSAFDRNSRISNRSVSSIETEEQRASREYREEIKTFSDCIFGSQVMAYKGTGTKMHIVPNDAKTSQYGTFATDNHYGSYGRSSMRNSKLSQSYTSENVSPVTPGGNNGTATITSERKKILITRIFSVPLPNDDVGDDSMLHSSHAEEGNGYPFPRIDDSRPMLEKKKPQPKQKRTPMYAVGLVITLPATSSVSNSTSRSSASRGPGSYTEQQDSFPSSYNSAKGAGWTMLSGIESLDSSFTSDIDIRVDNITHHWDIIMRTMSQLQAAVSAKVLKLLQNADLASPDPSRIAPIHIHPAGGARSSQDSKLMKPPKTTTKLVQLNPNALVFDEEIQWEMSSARKRVVNGLKAQQVVTAQGRWGIWREEARWVGKWAGGREEGFFFFNLLTSFLGNHTEWLQSLGPSVYRRRYYQQQRANRDEVISIPARTVIISEDKIIARKLIFLLSAFLPADQQPAASKLHRPSTSVSLGAYSQSPPSCTLSREESLRRQINKRSSANRGAHSRTRSFPAQQSQRSNIAASLLNVETFHERRPSDSGLAKSANLPIPGKEPASRNTSAATTATVTPATTMPHFSTRASQRGTGPFPRPGSSGSFATEDLIRSLNRVESTGQDSYTSNDSQGQNSGWGSMLSSLWSNTSARRRDSTATTPPAFEGLEINTQMGKKIQPKIKSANPVMESRPSADRKSSTDGGSVTPGNAPRSPLAGSDSRDQSPSLRRAGSSSLWESPVKSSVNEDDGVIDIEVSLPDFLTSLNSSFGSVRSSPSSSGYLSGPGLSNGLEGFERFPHLGCETDSSMNVGGWLKRFHPDFTLQATPSHADLEEEIKATMRAEPTPAYNSAVCSEDGTNGDRWIDVCTTVIADANNFTIKRLRYSRLIKAKPYLDPHADMASFFYPTSSRPGSTPITPSANGSETSVEDKFEVDEIVSMDDTLIEAVERIIAQSGEASRIPSAASSRSPSCTGSKVGGVRERSNSLSTAANGKVVQPQIGIVKPNECKKMVLGALEEIAKSVADGRRSEEVELGERGESVLREGVRRWLISVEES